jgi:hypothetical protein
MELVQYIPKPMCQKVEANLRQYKEYIMSFFLNIGNIPFQCSHVLVLLVYNFFLNFFIYRINKFGKKMCQKILPPMAIQFAAE